ncbi:hypothetical protein NIES4106_44160 [Fischerella sp. NIES-4106]|nr:hypothetical protein NIES4106_44160 [Fischerella sp. NIES-4106]
MCVYFSQLCLLSPIPISNYAKIWQRGVNDITRNFSNTGFEGDSEVLSFEVKRSSFKPEILSFEVERSSFKPEVLSFEVERSSFKPEVLSFEVERSSFKPEVLSFEVERSSFKPEVLSFEVELCLKYSAVNSFYLHLWLLVPSLFTVDIKIRDFQSNFSYYSYTVITN